MLFYSCSLNGAKEEMTPLIVGVMKIQNGEFGMGFLIAYNCRNTYFIAIL
jgi:ABC-type bacteriocin/lantibiotic exporter with double-glycine peptidase domain